MEFAEVQSRLVAVRIPSEYSMSIGEALVDFGCGASVLPNVQINRPVLRSVLNASFGAFISGICFLFCACRREK